MKKQVAMKPNIAPAVVTVRKVATYLRVHPSTIYRLLKQGKILGFRIDGSWRFHIKTIDDWRSQMQAHPRSQSSRQRGVSESTGNHPHSSIRTGA